MARFVSASSRSMALASSSRAARMARRPCGARPLVNRFHPLQGPEEVPGRRPRPLEALVDLLEIAVDRAARLRAQGHGAQDEAVGRGDADRRRAADDHLLDGLGHLDVGAAADVGLLPGELALVDHDDGTASPGDRRQHRSLLLPGRRPVVPPAPLRRPAGLGRGQGVLFGRRKRIHAAGYNNTRARCRCRARSSPKAGRARGP